LCDIKQKAFHIIMIEEKNLGKLIRPYVTNINETAAKMDMAATNLGKNLRHRSFGNLRLFIELCIATKQDITPVIAEILKENGIETEIDRLTAKIVQLERDNRLLDENNRFLRENAKTQ
jgi:hypothetical protein